MSQVITFYSYKGGVGRTMALANVAVLLSRWGYKTLVIDWDLEAPGLENFFKDYINVKQISKKKGIIDILNSDPPDKDLWRDLLIPISIPDGQGPLHLLTVGDRSDDYFNKIKDFDVNLFYEKKNGGDLIEALRNEWKAAYDFILVDSRTGITDIGGICTIQLPDVLVLIFTATEMGFNGILDVAQRAVKAQQSLPFDRFKLISLPIPARFDTLGEFKISRKWLDKFSKHLQKIYNDWLPLSVNRREFLELTKIPYVSYFSFGEKLPVIEQGVNDPSGLGYSYETLSALLADNFNSIEYLMDNRDQFIDSVVKNKTLQQTKKKQTKDTVNIFISYSHKDRALKDRLMAHLSLLEKEGFITSWSTERIVAGMEWEKEILKNIKNSQVCLLLISEDYLASKHGVGIEMKTISQMAAEGDMLVIPIILSPSPWKSNDFISQRFVLPEGGRPLSQSENLDDALIQVVKEIRKSILYIKSKIKNKIKNKKK